MSQGELAQALGTQRPVVSRWLHGDQKPSRRFARQLETLCGISQDDWDSRPKRKFGLQITKGAK